MLTQVTQEGRLTSSGNIDIERAKISISIREIIAEFKYFRGKTAPSESAVIAVFENMVPVPVGWKTVEDGNLVISFSSPPIGEALCTYENRLLEEIENYTKFKSFLELVQKETA